MKRAKLSNLEILLVSLARIGGEAHGVHTEDIAIEAFKLAPNRFGWRKYPERIDLESVRRALTSATEKEPPLLAGSVRQGWMISREGIRWLESNSQEVGQPAGYRRGSMSEGLEIERMRLRETNALKKYRAGLLDELNRNDLFEFARVNEYFSDAKRRERFNIVGSAVDGDLELTCLWNYLRSRFGNETES